MRNRWIKQRLDNKFSNPFVHIIFGARQTGKTTLISSIFPDPDIHYNLADPEKRTRLLSDPGLLKRECEALPITNAPSVVFIDEVQTVPSVFDTVQVLYDGDKTRWKFIL